LENAIEVTLEAEPSCEDNIQTNQRERERGSAKLRTEIDSLSIGPSVRLLWRR